MEPVNANHRTQFWHLQDDGRVTCTVCPRFCTLREGKRGACFVRQAIDGEIVLTTYGRSSGFCIDPIEKKPLNHFYPGSSVLSFGTAGCNLGCKFCQNWNISKSRQIDTLGSQASPEQIALTATKHQSDSIAFTYNDPVIFLEYAVDTALACKEAGVNTVAVSAGYMCDKPRETFYSVMDAANIDLKAFTERFYHKVCSGQLAPVLETLRYLKHETDVWLEITTLLIPDENDSSAEIDAMTQWVMDNLGPEVPLHFTAFHPDFKMLDKTRTPADSLVRARNIALNNGLHYVYVGNVHDEACSSTYCPSCHNKVLSRNWHQLGDCALTSSGVCHHCGHQIAGRFAKCDKPWGRKRIPVQMR
ncbi:Radical SAM superfamily protein [Vibrio mediterranei]|uniref:AmmeMemoRadiSam system radical SAM enzyme n=1 Tax=Vibrio mediterranei TaxID=689 RepID=A0ABX5DGX9_9VIBR|nr:AmmeMemoRadiSam system radical SAM enzyme [Vibrio mediterranei]PCD88144.1 AmmeMemoRadiSam system radical SAM enzyme [Vibrio mediterranei]PRQ68954.1 AmmeMemoRadiSam system radical SAM enzyme [Vibrio mediterranei]SBO08402.1 Radical SAM superfamily protein [Vibrio mediterranei]